MSDDNGVDWWTVVILLIVGMVIGNTLSNLPSDTTKMSKMDIGVIEDKAYEQGYIQGYQDCQSGLNK